MMPFDQPAPQEAPRGEPRNELLFDEDFDDEDFSYIDLEMKLFRGREKRCDQASYSRSARYSSSPSQPHPADTLSLAVSSFDEALAAAETATFSPAPASVESKEMPKAAAETTPAPESTHASVAVSVRPSKLGKCKEKKTKESVRKATKRVRRSIKSIAAQLSSFDNNSGKKGKRLEDEDDCGTDHTRPLDDEDDNEEYVPQYGLAA